MPSVFKPGDKVAFLNNEGKGKVVSLLDNDQVLIELDEGFEIPVHVGEIVKERDFIKGERETETGHQAENNDKTGLSAKNPGIFLAFDQSKGDNTRELYIINNTHYTLYFSMYEKRAENHFKGLSGGGLESGQTQMINRYNVQQFEDWPTLVVQVLLFTAKTDNLPAPVYYTFKPRARAFFNAIQQAPVLERTAHLFRLDVPEARVQKENRDQREKRAEKEYEAGKQEENLSVERPPEVIDLHIDRLIPDYKAMERDVILNYQLEYFEQTLDKAIALNYNKIIFIHGIGNGVLRERVHGILKRKQGIHSYKEADPQQYGYGATEVRLVKD